jgi:Asp-tRNA(Asn)/Glu-tRNA(Gln) amidotransferase B subunit
VAAPRGRRTARPAAAAVRALRGELGLNDYDASVLIDQKEVALFFDELARLTPTPRRPPTG